jgi:ankyrin repeat protein
MSDTVKLFIAQELERLRVQKEDHEHGALATYNLGYCYIDGVGVNENIEVGLSLLEQAAESGCQRARTQLLRFYSSGKALDNRQQTNFARWSETSIEEQDKPALRVLRIVAPDVFSHLRAEWALERALQVDNKPAINNVNRPWMTWRAKLLYFAASNDMPGLMERMLQAEPALISAKNNYGQTPLMAACQSANLGITQYLLNNGSDVHARDDNGFTALHWLISFSDNEKKTVATALGARNVDSNVYGLWPEISQEIPPNLRGGPAINGTPLHWAIACSDLTAVELLIPIGAHASLITQYRPTPFEYACELSEVDILLRLLQDPATKLAAAEYLPLQGSRDMIKINALFWVVMGGSRLARLMRHGRDFETKTEQTIRCLVKAGNSCEGVLVVQQLKMSAPFATAFHQCNADIMRAGLAHGFAPYIDTTFGGATSGGPAMSLAFAHRDRKMFQYLLEAGASVTWRNLNKQPPLSMAAKETDDKWFAEQLLEKGVELDDIEGPISAFWTAVYCGNLNIARYLWEKGAKRDSRNKQDGMTVLGELVGLRTRNASERIQFILGLPDRDESDGFEVLHSTDPIQHKASALHLACSPYSSADPFTEDSETEETCRLTVSLLLRKYGAPNYLNNTIGPHYDTPLGLAVEIGNHHAVRLLLEAGADPSVQDEYSRTPLDKLYWRYCYPATLDVLAEARDDRRKVAQRLAYVNQNTSEILSLLTSYGAKANVFRFPSWHQSDPGYRSLDWVLARLKENAERPPIEQTTPIWGGMPITIPDRPMQFEARRRLAEQREAGKEGQQAGAQAAAGSQTNSDTEGGGGQD